MHAYPRFVLAILPPALASAPFAFAQAPPPALQADVVPAGEEFKLSLDEPTAVKVDGWIVRLGSASYEARQGATQGLIQVGAPAMNRLRTAYHRSDDLETRLRIEQIVRTAYMNHHVLDKHGFLGISMRPYEPGRPNARLPKGFDTKLPEGRVGVLVAGVIDDTGAFHAGVAKDDVIIALNGKPVEGSGRGISNSFSSIIRDLRPGAVVDLTIIRGATELSISATLHRPPENVARANNIIVVSQEYNKFTARFHPWWELHFHNDPAGVQSSIGIGP